MAGNERGLWVAGNGRDFGWQAAETIGMTCVNGTCRIKVGVWQGVEHADKGRVWACRVEGSEVGGDTLCSK